MLDRRDADHAWAVKKAARLPRRFHTCEAVLSEAHFVLRHTTGGPPRLVEFLKRDQLDVSFSYADHAPRIHTLMQRYANVPMSFADACLVCMAEQGESTVFTLDGDFRIYRLKRNKPIPLITPGRKAR